MYSITRRLAGVVLLSELLLTVAVTAVTWGYERSQRYKAFDVMLRGRADSLLSAVEVDETTERPVVNRKSVDVPDTDVYDIRADDGEDLGHSQGDDDAVLNGATAWNQIVKIRAGKKRYRAVVVHGSRTVDPDGQPVHQVGVTIRYASSTEPIREAVFRAGVFFAGANFVLLLLSGVLAVVFIRRGTRPLKELAVEAGSISPQSLKFHAPASAREVTELAGLAHALETAVAGLERSFRQQETFLHDAAHELKTAVTIIKSSLQLLLYRERTNEQYRRGVEASLADCGRMEELVLAMLALARIEQQAAATEAASNLPVDAASAIRQAVEQLIAPAELREVEIELDVEDGLSSRVSGEDWGSLVSNLVLNAVRHSRKGSSVHVSACMSGERVELVVQDSGTGIPAADLPFVFDRFYRGDASRDRSTGGTGLGLAICRAIAESYGGEIRIDSEVGAGTRVAVMLPTVNTGEAVLHHKL